MSSKTSSKASSSIPTSSSASLKLHPKTASSSTLTSSPSTSSIVALPSMSSHLFILPQARHMESLPVHPTSSAQRYAESEAKLKKALERNAAKEERTGVPPMPAPPALQPPPPPPMLQPTLPMVGQGHHYQMSGHHQQSYPPRTFIPQPVYSEPSSPISHSPPIMMRSRQKPAC